jgi:hypothetical protein
LWKFKERTGKCSHEQVCEIWRALRQLDAPASRVGIGRIFGVTKGTIARHLTGLDWSEQPERGPSWLNQSRRYAVAQFINKQFVAGTPSSCADASPFLDVDFNLQIPMGTLRHCVRGKKGFKHNPWISAVPTSKTSKDRSSADVDPQTREVVKMLA